jgi:glycolate oxidase
MSITKDTITKLHKILGDKAVLVSKADLSAFSYDATSNWQGMPEIVLFPTDVSQVSSIMALANENGIPVTVRGAGTNLSGGSIPVFGGIVLCTTRMNRIIEIDAGNFTAIVEAGVVLNDLNRELAKQNLFFPPDPQSFLAATIGGCVAENSGGPYGLKYGVFKHYLLGINVVLASGTIISLGGRTIKNVTGYDLPSLICGSEGTLAVVTQATLRLIPMPESKQTVMAVFNDVITAGAAVNKILSGGIRPAKTELIDNWIIRRIEESAPLGLPVDAEAILLFELDGANEAVRMETEKVVSLCYEAGAADVRQARDKKEADNFWTARRLGFSAIYGNAPTAMAEDVTVPIDKMPELMERVKKIGKENDIMIVTMGHAGDGNLHPCILTDKKNPEHYARAQKTAQAIFEAALELNGVISGEHGIGLEKRKYLKNAMAPEAIDMLKQIKSVFDPKGILNPGKIWE